VMIVHGRSKVELLTSFVHLTIYIPTYDRQIPAQMGIAQYTVVGSNEDVAKDVA
jgi:hypothetical protein